MRKTQKNDEQQKRKGAPTAGVGNVRMETPSVDKHSPLLRPHGFASPARSHNDTNTKRNRNRFPDWGSPASINFPQSPNKMIWDLPLLIWSILVSRNIKQLVWRVRDTSVSPGLIQMRTFQSRPSATQKLLVQSEAEWYCKAFGYFLPVNLK